MPFLWGVGDEPPLRYRLLPARSFFGGVGERGWGWHEGMTGLACSVAGIRRIDMQRCRHWKDRHAMAGHAGVDEGAASALPHQLPGFNHPLPMQATTRFGCGRGYRWTQLSCTAAGAHE